MGILVGDRCFFELNTTDYESVGRTFESCGAHHFFNYLRGTCCSWQVEVPGRSARFSRRLPVRASSPAADPK